MGSEMCIRDRSDDVHEAGTARGATVDVCPSVSSISSSMPVTCGTISDGSGTLAAGAGADAEAVVTAGADGADGAEGGNGGGGATVRVRLGCDSLVALAGAAEAAVVEVVVAAAAAAAADGLDVVVDAGTRSGSGSSSGSGSGSGSAAVDPAFGSTELAVNAAAPSSAWPSPCIST